MQPTSIQNIALELKPEGQEPILITLNSIEEIHPSRLWEKPSLEIHLKGGRSHQVAFPNEEQRASFYQNIANNFRLFNHQITHIVTDK